MITVVSLLILVLALVIGIPVPFAFLTAVTYLIFTGDYNPSFLLPYGFSKMNTIVILAIPLFIIAGGLINRSKVGDKLVSLVELFVGRIKGGTWSCCYSFLRSIRFNYRKRLRNFISYRLNYVSKA